MVWRFTLRFVQANVSVQSWAAALNEKLAMMLRTAPEKLRTAAAPIPAIPQHAARPILLHLLWVIP